MVLAVSLTTNRCIDGWYQNGIHKQGLTRRSAFSESNKSESVKAVTEKIKPIDIRKNKKTSQPKGNNIS